MRSGTFIFEAYILRLLSQARTLSRSQTVLHFATVPVSEHGCLQTYMLQYLLPPPTHIFGDKGRAR